MIKKGIDKGLLSNIIRHMDAHNKIQEEKAMWKQHETLERSRSRDGHRRSDRDRRERYRSSRSRSPLRDRHKEHGSQHDDDSWCWRKFVTDFGEKDDNGRWGHGGYKELYPDEFVEAPAAKESASGKVEDLDGRKAPKRMVTAKTKKRKKDSEKKKKKKMRKDSRKVKRSSSRRSRKRSYSSSYSESESLSEGEDRTKWHRKHQTDGRRAQQQTGRNGKQHGHLGSLSPSRRGAESLSSDRSSSDEPRQRKKKHWRERSLSYDRKEVSFYSSDTWSDSSVDLGRAERRRRHRKHKLVRRKCNSDELYTLKIKGETSVQGNDQEMKDDLTEDSWHSEDGSVSKRHKKKKRRKHR